MYYACASVLRPEDAVEVTHQQRRDGGGEVRSEAAKEGAVVMVIHVQVEEGKSAGFGDLNAARLYFSGCGRNAGEDGAN